MTKLGQLVGMIWVLTAGVAAAAPITSVAICGPLSCTATVSAVPFLVSTPQEFIWDFSAAPFVTNAGSNPVVSIQVAINLNSITPNATTLSHDLLQGPGGIPYAASLGGSSGANIGSINLFPTYTSPATQFTNLTAELLANSGVIYTRFSAAPVGSANLVGASVTVNFQPPGIPEPATYVLIGTGLAVCLVMRRRRGDQKS